MNRNYIYQNTYNDAPLHEHEHTTIPQKLLRNLSDSTGSFEECVHLISPCSSYEEDIYMELEEREQYDSSHEISLCLTDERSDCSYDERSYCTNNERSWIDSEGDEREQAPLSESKKALLFSQQSVPKIPSPYPHLRKMRSGNIRYSTSSLHPLQHHNMAKQNSKKQHSGRQDRSHRKDLKTNNVHRHLTPILETLKTDVSLTQKYKKYGKVSNSPYISNSILQGHTLSHNTNTECSARRKRHNKRCKPTDKEQDSWDKMLETRKENVKVNSCQLISPEKQSVRRRLFSTDTRSRKQRNITDSNGTSFFFRLVQRMH